MANTQPLFNPNDSLTGRDGGPYLDQEQAKYYEIQRAKVEGREPDLDNPPAHAGIPLVNAAELLRTENVNNIPSQQNTGPTAEAAVKALVDSSDNLLKPAGEIDVDALNAEPAEGSGEEVEGTSAVDAPQPDFTTEKA